jgi:hypothetical protein
MAQGGRFFLTSEVTLYMVKALVFTVTKVSLSRVNASRHAHSKHYRGASLVRNTPLQGPYCRTIPRVLGWSQGRGLFLSARSPCTGHVPPWITGGGRGKYADCSTPWIIHESGPLRAIHVSRLKYPGGLVN